MPLTLSSASEADANRIAAIHMAAFNTNLMLRAQFPTPSIRASLQTCIAEKAVCDILDPKQAVVVVRDPDSNEIISFAKWSLPVLEGEEYVESPWRWPKGTDLEVLDGWTEKVEVAQKKVLGGKPCYHISFVGTGPTYERRGAASLLLEWALEGCKRDNYPAYLEGTINAASLYERHRFKAVETLSMVLKGGTKGEAPVTYEETCFLFRPERF